MKKSLWGSAASVGAAALLLTTFAGPAQAAPSSLAAANSVVAAGQSQTTTDEATGLTTTIKLGTPTTVTAATIKADKGLTTQQKDEILSTQAVTASNHWSQFTTGGSYTQTQNGRFYYNGSRVWVTQTYAGSTGSHTCYTSYSVPPWTISGVSKSDGGSTTSRNLSCRWQVTQPFGIVTSASMTATLNKSGGISGFGATVG